MDGRKYMGMKIRTVDWCEHKIIKVLNKQKQIVSYLALSKKVLIGGVRGLAEKHNLDTAIGRLLLSGKIKFDKTPNGIRTYRLVKSMGKNIQGE